MSDTIRILVATDNHVGAHERDPNRGDDSWKTFHEIMELARSREVDMVLLAGDLFHENKPSRKSLYNVMRSLRMNCLGPRPCELEVLSDGSQAFDATFDYANYEDPDINVSIPVFSIHGNHDDPTGDGHLAALDLLAVSGLINYFGRAHESDRIEVKPVLLQKGSTKLALYGLSNVRDERLHRTFKEHKVTFYQAGAQQSDWFNLICVHQNHHPRTDTNWLPESFLPEFLDLVIWGHEHDCQIEPRFNPEMNFHVMQPGSSVATSLVPGEAEAKYVSILSITGREFKSEPIRLTTVRPFIYKDVVLAEDKVAMKLGADEEHRTKLTAHLIEVVDEMIKDAKVQWEESQVEAGLDSSQSEQPLPLVRLRVEYTKPDGMDKFQVENPQRFSNRFQGKVANTNDVVQFHIKKRTAVSSATLRAAKDAKKDEEIMARMALEGIQVEHLVKEYLAAQSLTILPQQPFGNAVSEYVDKDDRTALDDFVSSSLAKQISELGKYQGVDDDSEDEGEEILTKIQEIKAVIESQYANHKAKTRKKKYNPRPAGWDSDNNGPWEEQPAAQIRETARRSSVEDVGDSDEDGTPAATTTRGRGRGRGARGGRGAATSTRGRGTTARGRGAAASKTTKSRSRRQVSDEEEEEEHEDVAMLDEDDDDDEAVEQDEDSDSQAMFYASNTRKATTQSSNGTSASRRGASSKKAPAPKATPAKATRKTPARGAAKASAGPGKQSTLAFSASQASVLGTRGGGRGKGAGDEVESIGDDSDGFEELASQPVRRGRGR